MSRSTSRRARSVVWPSVVASRARRSTAGCPVQRSLRVRRWPPRRAAADRSPRPAAAAPSRSRGASMRPPSMPHQHQIRWSSMRRSSTTPHPTRRSMQGSGDAHAWTPECLTGRSTRRRSTGRRTTCRTAHRLSVVASSSSTCGARIGGKGQPETNVNTGSNTVQAVDAGVDEPVRHDQKPMPMPYRRCVAASCSYGSSSSTSSNRPMSNGRPGARSTCTRRSRLPSFCSSSAR